MELKLIPEDVRKKLLEQSLLGKEEVEARLKSALAPSYWRELAPWLQLDAGPSAELLESPPIDTPTQGEHLEQLAREGYFQTKPIMAAPAIESMRRAVEILLQKSWHPVFAFVYDAFWLAMRAPSLMQILSGALGSSFLQIPHHIWTYYIHPIKGASGWPPHADGAGKDQRVNVWVPLSDATLDNGCMYVIPKDQAPAFDLRKQDTFGRAEMTAMLQGTRAVPAEAGSLLCWDFNVIHWGAKFRKGQQIGRAHV